ncbi:uncharacterized protein LOC105170714 [Sesamum indicum]|uniref:Uncharacterized protein LOC105170714 n=1 Tax=Sesamum indicum TaxID=4182 RepID=A0A6I9TXT4_SESIN|nr:uncharacterized protein LOC105170714 [Sesamum indicum]
MAPLLIFAFLSFLSITRAEDRAHGLANQSPMAISPDAYSFFHPNALQPSAANPCVSSSCSTMPLAATVKSTPAQQSAPTRSRGLGAGGIAGISLSFLFVCLVGMGVYYVSIKRRANLERAANPEQQAKV